MSKFVAASILALILSVTGAFAGPIVDFSLGPTGTLHTGATTVGNFTVSSMAGGSLYRWNTWAYDHFDGGFGILGPGEGINGYQPEINKTAVRQEWLRVVSYDRLIAGIWLSSVNNLASLNIYPHWYPAGSHLNVTTSSCQRGEGAPLFSCYLALPQPTPVLWVTSGGGCAHNYAIVWGVDPVVETVPEPGSLTLLGIGLLALAQRYRANGEKNGDRW